MEALMRQDIKDKKVGSLRIFIGNTQGYSIAVRFQKKWKNVFYNRRFVLNIIQYEVWKNCSTLKFIGLLIQKNPSLSG